MTTIGLRELRQNASEILREVEAGHSATVTVSGRPVAEIVPLRSDRWVSWEQAREVFDTRIDSELAKELKEFGDSELLNPWDR